MTTNLNELSWADRFAIIDALNPTDEQVLAALDIDADELATARELRDAGQFQTVTADLDIEAYASVFGNAAVAEIENVEDTTDESTAAPATATAPAATRVAKKRGRKGTKISEAFTAIPTTPTDATAYATKYGVSLNVLRQAKRFDTTGIVGRVRVKTVDGVLCIYREENTAS